MNHGSPRRLAGPVLFTLYSVAYLAFVLIAAFGTFAGGEPVGGLAAQAFGGITWGVVAGFGLIIGALVLALAYAWIAPAAKESGE